MLITAQSQETLREIVEKLSQLGGTQQYSLKNHFM